MLFSSLTYDKRYLSLAWHPAPPPPTLKAVDIWFLYATNASFPLISIASLAINFKPNLNRIMAKTAADKKTRKVKSWIRHCI